jgi:superfamily II DNA or RNA helicase
MHVPDSPTAEVAATAVLPAPRQLRGYQQEAVDAVIAEWDDGIQRTSVIAPTGAGKSTIMSALAVKAREQGKRTVILAHRRELLDAISETVDDLDPGGQTPGIVMGSDNEPDTDIVCASFQTLSRSARKREAVGDRDLILVDECHHILAKTYLKVLADFGLDVDPDMTAAQMKNLSADDVVRTGQRPDGPLACGFTATMTRADGGKLGAVWSTIAFERDLKWAIDNGFLVPPRGLTVVTEHLNLLARIKTVGGDYKQSDLDEVMRASIPTTVDAVLRHAADRVPIIFAVSVEQGEELAAELTARGYPTRSVSGSHSKAERQEIYRQFRSGEIRAMVTVQVLTEGADFPRCDCVVLARPTRSDVLFAQIVGRGVRLYTDPDTGQDKTDALVTLTQLYAEAETQEFDDEGNEIPEDLPPEPTDGRLFDPTPERQGPVDLEEVELFVSDMPPVAVTTTPAGLVFLPSPAERSGEHIFLWPPNPDTAEKVYLVRTDDRGSLHPLCDDRGRPVPGTYHQALSAAGKLAQQAQISLNRKSSWRRSSTAGSQKMIDYARTLGIPSPDAMTAAALSDAISGVKLDAQVNSRLRWLTSLQWG